MGTLRAILVTGVVSAGLSWSQLGHAATNVVMNLKDGLIVGTLRSVIANSSAGDTITFSNNLSGTISLTNGGQLLINKNLTIHGPGAKIITISGSNSNRVLSITNAAVNLFGLTFANGRVVGANGAAGSAGETTLAAGLLNWHSIAGFEVTVTDCAFIQNMVSGGNGGGTPFGGGGAGGDVYGGAVLNNAVLRMRNCCFAGNSVIGGSGGAGSPAGGKGGSGSGSGIWNSGFLALTNCTFATNTATGGNGGGTPGGLTFPGNGGNGEGVAIYNLGNLEAVSCTIANNSASGGYPGTGGPAIRGGAYGGGIRTSAGAVEIGNTIVANNAGVEAPDVSGAFTSQGFNLISATNGSGGFGVTFDQAGRTNDPINPQLGTLQDNGGPTWTLALLTNSPAIDQGSDFGGTVDQRGANRPSDFPSVSNSADGSDIGAYELIAPLLSISQSTSNVLLSWSIFNTGYSLQSTTNLAGSNWVSVAGTVVVGNRFYVTNALSIGSKFFRLRSP